MLEFINCRTIWYEHQSMTQMPIAVLVCIFAKKVFHPRPSQKLHAHGMYFTCLKCREIILQESIIPAHVCLKCMPRFMRENIDIVRSSIEIAENKRRTVFGYVCAISSRGFARHGPQAHQFVTGHEIKKLPCFI